ncbi:MAG TPA: aldo/keto reductase [Chloroflexia bacterium]|nr:aldo/keto reductase [Chloroflexia bacterium]
MPIPTLPFGRLGHESTRTVFGAASLWSVSQDDADRTLDLLLQHGVNHIDVAASYGDAELRLAPWLKRYPDRFFLATKTGERTAQGAREELHRSLERLGVDHVDLWQLHNLVDEQEWQTAFGPGGALEAAIEAKQQGLVRGIGVTGHGVEVAAMHRRSLERFDFDSVLLPYNYTMMQNPQYAADFEALLALCRERNVAVQTIKSALHRPWGEREHTATTWYEPLNRQDAVDAAVWWVLARPGVFLCTVGDIHVLPLVLDAASRFDPATTQASLEDRLSKLNMEPLFV